MKANAQTDLAEIAIGKLAMTRTSNADLLKVAKVTMANHETALAKLKDLAQRDGVQLPATPSVSQRADATRLMSLPAASFNRTWDEIQITGHKVSISQTQTEISQGSSPAVISFAKYYLPIAQMHLAMAETLSHQLA